MIKSLAFLINPFFLVLAILFYTQWQTIVHGQDLVLLKGWLAWHGSKLCENLFPSLFWKQFVLLLFHSESKNLWLSVYKNRGPGHVEILRTFSFQI